MPSHCEVVELLGQAPEVTGAVVGGVVEAPDEDLVEDGPLVPAVVRRVDAVRHPSRLAHEICGPD